jgi:hypothetical protein
MGVELSGKIIARQIPMAKSGTDAPTPPRYKSG